MKTFSRFLTIGVGGLCLFSIGNAQDFGTKQAIDSSDFYIFTEAGGTYVPSVTFSDVTASESFSLNQTISGVLIDISAVGTTQVSNFVAQSGVGYNFLLGFGYQINSGLGIEIEVGYSQSTLTAASYEETGSYAVTGTIAGNNVTNLSTSGSVSLSGRANLTQIPILVGLSAQDRSEKFQPMASFGIGICPSFFNGSLSSASGNLGFTATGPAITASGNLSSEISEAASLSSSTAFPFAFKFKAGFDYALSPNTSVGLKAWAMGLANSNFGDQLKSDIYGTIGLNAAFKARF